MFGKRKKKTEKAEWIAYNIFTDLEFAECSKCGYEIDGISYEFENKCPGCGRKVRDVILAETEE